MNDSTGNHMQQNNVDWKKMIFLFLGLGLFCLAYYSQIGRASCRERV